MYKNQCFCQCFRPYKASIFTSKSDSIFMRFHPSLLGYFFTFFHDRTLITEILGPLCGPAGPKMPIKIKQVPPKSIKKHKPCSLFGVPPRTCTFKGPPRRPKIIFYGCCMHYTSNFHDSGPAQTLFQTFWQTLVIISWHLQFILI